MISGTVRSLLGSGLVDAECVPWVPIALVIALAAIAVIGAFVLRRDPREREAGDDVDVDPEG